MYVRNVDEGIPKYRKKKESSVSKSERKTRHKHQYVDCLVVGEDGIDKKSVHRGSYCPLCGKINDVYYFESEKTFVNDKNGESKFAGYRLLDPDEILKKYRDLPKIKARNVEYDF